MENIASKNKKDISVKVALLIAIITAVVTGASGPVATLIINRMEEKRLFVLHQLKSYGNLYFISVGGTKEQFLKELNDNMVYIDPEDIDFISRIVHCQTSALQALFPKLPPPGADWLLSYKDGLELSEKLLGKYRDKFELYKKMQIKREEHFFRKYLEEESKK